MLLRGPTDAVRGLAGVRVFSLRGDTIIGRLFLLRLRLKFDPDFGRVGVEPLPEEAASSLRESRLGEGVTTDARGVPEDIFSSVCQSAFENICVSHQVPNRPST